MSFYSETKDPDSSLTYEHRSLVLIQRANVNNSYVIKQTEQMLDVQLSATCNYSVTVHAPLQAEWLVLQWRRT